MRRRIDGRWRPRRACGRVRRGRRPFRTARPRGASLSAARSSGGCVGRIRRRVRPQGAGGRFRAHIRQAFFPCRPGGRRAPDDAVPELRADRMAGEQRPALHAARRADRPGQVCDGSRERDPCKSLALQQLPVRHAVLGARLGAGRPAEGGRGGRALCQRPRLPAYPSRSVGPATAIRSVGPATAMRSAVPKAAPASPPVARPWHSARGRRGWICPAPPRPSRGCDRPAKGRLAPLSPARPARYRLPRPLPKYR